MLLPESPFEDESAETEALQGVAECDEEIGQYVEEAEEAEDEGGCVEGSEQPADVEQAPLSDLDAIGKRIMTDTFFSVDNHRPRRYDII